MRALGILFGESLLTEWKHRCPMLGIMVWVAWLAAVCAGWWLIVRMEAVGGKYADKSSTNRGRYPGRKSSSTFGLPLIPCRTAKYLRSSIGIASLHVNLTAP